MAKIVRTIVLIILAYLAFVITISIVGMAIGFVVKVAVAALVVGAAVYVIYYLVTGRSLGGGGRPLP